MTDYKEFDSLAEYGVRPVVAARNVADINR